jgi:hypothetical protein
MPLKKRLAIGGGCFSVAESSFSLCNRVQVFIKPMTPLILHGFAETLHSSDSEQCLPVTLTNPLSQFSAQWLLNPLLQVHY